MRNEQTRKKLLLALLIIEMVLIVVSSAIYTQLGNGDSLVSYMLFLPLFSLLSIIGTYIGIGLFKLKIEKIKQFVVINAIILSVSIAAGLVLIVFPMIRNPI